MGSKFENFALGRQVAKFLKLKDPKNFPTELHTDQLQPVLSIGLDPMQLISGFLIGNMNIGAGISMFSVGLVGTDFFPALAGSSNDPIVVQPVYNPASKYKVMQFQLDITLDAAGVAANLKHVISTTIAIAPVNQSPNTFFPVAQFDWATIQTGKTDYRFTFPMMQKQVGVDIGTSTSWNNCFAAGHWDGIVPPGYICAVATALSNPDASINWPVNSQVSGVGLIAEFNNDVG